MPKIKVGKCNYDCDLGKTGRGKFRVYCRREKGCAQNGKKTEAWQMTKEEARDKESLLRQEKNLAYQKADDLLKKAIGKKKIFVKGSAIALSLRKDEFIKYGSSYIWKSKITPNIQKALDDAASIKKQASNKYAKEATPLNAHYQSVKKAIIEGKPVPAKVLKEYGAFH